MDIRQREELVIDLYPPAGWNLNFERAHLSPRVLPANLDGKRFLCFRLQSQRSKRIPPARPVPGIGHNMDPVGSLLGMFRLFHVIRGSSHQTGKECEEIN